MGKIIKCKNCGSEIDANAKYCLKCGVFNKKPSRMKYILGAIGIFFVFIFFLAAIGSNGNKSVKTATDTTVSTDASKTDTSKADAKQKSNAPKLYKIGDTIELKDYKVTVNGVRSVTQDKSGFLKAEDGKEFFLVDCTIENISEKDQVVSSMLMFKIVDKDGMSYNQSIFTDANGNLDGTVGSTRKIKGEYCVEVPKGQTGLELEFNSSFIGNQQVIVELN